MSSGQRASSSTDTYQRPRKAARSKPEFDDLDSEGSASGAEGHPVVKIVVDDVRPCLHPFGRPLDHFRVDQFDAQVPPPAFGLMEVRPVLIASMSITELDEKPDPALALDPLSSERRSSEVEGKPTGVCTTFHFVTT